VVQEFSNAKGFFAEATPAGWRGRNRRAEASGDRGKKRQCIADGHGYVVLSLCANWSEQALAFHSDVEKRIRWLRRELFWIAGSRDDRNSRRLRMRGDSYFPGFPAYVMGD